jgi:hypothetical protein
LRTAVLYDGQSLLFFPHSSSGNDPTGFFLWDVPVIRNFPEIRAQNKYI